LLKGDIDNRPAPAIVVDIDEIIIKPLSEKLWRRVQKGVKLPLSSYQLNSSIYPFLEHLLYLGIDVYLFAHRNKAEYENLERLFQGLVYSRLYVGGKKEREALLSRRNVHTYYYIKPEHASTLNKSKERRLTTWHQIGL